MKEGGWEGWRGGREGGSKEGVERKEGDRAHIKPTAVDSLKNHSF